MHRDERSSLHRSRRDRIFQLLRCLSFTGLQPASQLRAPWSRRPSLSNVTWSVSEGQAEGGPGACLLTMSLSQDGSIDSRMQHGAESTRSANLPQARI